MAEWNNYEAARQKNQNNEDNDKWKNMLSMLNAVNNTSPDTMLGYGLGKMLKRWVGTAYDDYMRGREARAQAKKDKQNGNAQSGPMITAKGLLPEALLGASASTGPVAEQPQAALFSGYNQPSLAEMLYGNNPFGAYEMGAMVIPEQRTLKELLPQRGEGHGY